MSSRILLGSLTLVLLSSCATKELDSFECSYQDEKGGKTSAVYQLNQVKKEITWVSTNEQNQNGRSESIEGRTFRFYQVKETISWKDDVLNRDYFLNTKNMKLTVAIPGEYKETGKDAVLSCKNL